MKRDLNLIPRAETESSLNKYILPVVLIVVLYAATAYLAITIPQQRLQAKEDEYASLQQKVIELEPVEIQYQQLRAQLAEIEAKKRTIEQTKHSETDPSNILVFIEQACPEDILLDEVNISEDGVVILGTSLSDSLIAEFMVNLRAVELFYGSNITSIIPQEPDFDIEQLAAAAGVELPEIREFQLTLSYMPAIVAAEGELEGGES